MSGSKEEDLNSLLTTEQRAELTLLITLATERMRQNITEVFDSGPTRSASPPAAEPKPTELEGLESSLPTDPKKAPKQLDKELNELKKSALASFDSWSAAVLQRISEAVHSSSSSTPQSLPPRTSTVPSTAPTVPDIYAPIPTPLTTLPDSHKPPVLTSLLLLLLSLEHYDARSRVLLLILCSSLHLPASVLIAQESQTATALVTAAMSADEATQGRSGSGRWWKVGLASVAGAVAIGVTGGLAAPLVAAGVGSVMGGIGLGGTVAAGYLGVLASSGAVVGTLFGAYGAKMGGKMVSKYADAVKDFAFLPVAGKDRLRVTIGISGWLTEVRDVVAPWECLNGAADVYALRWEVDALLDLGSAMSTILKSYAWGYVGSEVIKRTVFAALWGAVMLPMSIMKVTRVLDNPFSIAKHRAEKTGRVLADAIINRAQGERPVTLLGYSLGARVIYSCLLSLAERGHFGVVENVVMMGAPVPADADDWQKVRSVVAGRCINVYCASDYVLALLYRTSSVQYGVAGLQRIAVRGVENINPGKVVEGHLGYRKVVGVLLQGVMGEDVERGVVKREEAELEVMREEEERMKEKGKKGEHEGDEVEEEIDSVVEKAERELEERRRKRAALEKERREAMGETEG